MRNWYWGYTGPVKDGIIVIGKQLYTYEEWYTMHNLKRLPYTKYFLAVIAGFSPVAIHVLLNIFGLHKVSYAVMVISPLFTKLHLIISFIILNYLK